MKQLWKKFDKLTEICYMSELEDNCPQWDEAYEVFKQLVAQGREKDPQYAAEILKMDDATDFAYGVADWIEDYLDELDAREEHEKLMERCEELLNLFQWQEVYPGDLKFRIASALAAEDKKEEALTPGYYTRPANDPLYPGRKASDPAYLFQFATQEFTEKGVGDDGPVYNAFRGGSLVKNPDKYDMNAFASMFPKNAIITAEGQEYDHLDVRDDEPTHIIVNDAAFTGSSSALDLARLVDSH